MPCDSPKDRQQDEILDLTVLKRNRLRISKDVSVLRLPIREPTSDWERPIAFTPEMAFRSRERLVEHVIGNDSPGSVPPVLSVERDVFIRRKERQLFA